MGSADIRFGFAELLAVLLFLAASAITVTPRLQNMWAAAIAWGCTVAWAIFIANRHREDIVRFTADHPVYSTLSAMLVMAIFGGVVWHVAIVPLAQQRRPTTESAVVARFEEIFIGRYTKDPDAEHVWILVSVVNQGPPTILERWALTYNPDQPDEREATSLLIDRDIPLELSTGEIMTVVRPADTLPPKTYPRPLPTGGSERGWLWFIFRNFPAEKFDKRIRLQLNYEDAYGHSYYTFEEGIFGSNTRRRMGAYEGLTLENKGSSEGLLRSQQRTETNTAEILKILGDKASHKTLSTKYPLGYVIYETDHRNSVIPYKKNIFQKYEYNIAWDTASITSVTEKTVTLRAPDVNAERGLSLKDYSVGLPRVVGATTGVLTLRDDGPEAASMVIELLSVKDGEIVFVVGLRPRGPRGK
jgi:hypothetical protein